MAKYNWIELEKEYVLGDYKSVSAFLKEKNIPNNGSTKKSTKGWKSKKVLKEEQKSTKVIEKVLERKSEQEVQRILKINDVANNLLKKVMEATDELNIQVDMFGNQHNSIIDRSDLKKMTSALKDLNDILSNKEEPKNNNGILGDLIGALKNVKKDR